MLDFLVLLGQNDLREFLLTPTEQIRWARSHDCYCVERNAPDLLNEGQRIER
jgi:hypothetical protein